MATVRIIVDSDTARAAVHFRYDPKLVELIKTSVPASGRTYDPDTKGWTISLTWLEQLVNAFESNHVDIVVGDEPPPPPPKPPVEPGFFAETKGDVATIDAIAEGMLAQIPEKIRGKVFRAMARVLYPDLYPPRKAKN